MESSIPRETAKTANMRELVAELAVANVNIETINHKVHPKRNPRLPAINPQHPNIHNDGGRFWGEL